MANLNVFMVEVCFFSFHSLVRQLEQQLWSLLPSQVRPSPEYPGLHVQL